MRLPRRQKPSPASASVAITTRRTRHHSRTGGATTRPGSRLRRQSVACTSSSKGRRKRSEAKYLYRTLVVYLEIAPGAGSGACMSLVSWQLAGSREERQLEAAAAATTRLQRVRQRASCCRQHRLVTITTGAACGPVSLWGCCKLYRRGMETTGWSDDGRSSPATTPVTNQRRPGGHAIRRDEQSRVGPRSALERTEAASLSGDLRAGMRAAYSTASSHCCPATPHRTAPTWPKPTAISTAISPAPLAKEWERCALVLVWSASPKASSPA